ncbi:hypothetical protein ZEAMMB73_Zm00001d033393 [Zea mays]|uniref:Uncharacterized protein n=1 Tax=Zea mays TaxID=4577 RepID=A0A1D6KYS6_MAIZE|nr:hypothetical protein ZEAMMB73_Zm00001d033393 [Zea mays]
MIISDEPVIYIHSNTFMKNKNRECNGKWKVKALLIDNLGKDGMELKFWWSVKCVELKSYILS